MLNKIISMVNSYITLYSQQWEVGFGVNFMHDEAITNTNIECGKR